MSGACDDERERPWRETAGSDGYSWEDEVDCLHTDDDDDTDGPYTRDFARPLPSADPMHLLPSADVHTAGTDERPSQENRSGSFWGMSKRAAGVDEQLTAVKTSAAELRAQAPQPIGQGGPADWACRVCTFVNAGGMVECEMCSTRQDLPVKRSAPASSHSTAGAKRAKRGVGQPRQPTLKQFLNGQLKCAE